LSDYHDRNTRSRAMSFHQSSVYVGTILGSWLGAWFAETISWRTGFYFFGISGIMLALVLYKLLREPTRGESENRVSMNITTSLSPLPFKETLHVIFHTPVVPLLMCAFVCANFVATIFLTWTPTFLVEKFGFKLTTAGLSGTVFIHLASAFSVPVAGTLADYLRKTFSGGRMLVQALGLIIGAFFVFLVGSTSDITTLILSMTVFGLCKGFYDSGIFASLYDSIEPRARCTAAGLMNTVGWGGGALGPLFIGIASKYGNKPTEMQNMSEAIAWCGAIYIFGSGLMFAAMYFFQKRHY
jgi:MFS family permease